MSAVMARQAVEDQKDTFVRDLKRVANRVAYEQDPETTDVALVQAARLYLNWEATDG